VAEEYFPFDSGPGADSTEARWRRMARTWAPSGVVGSSGDDAYAATISGLALTIKRRAATGVAEAWVDGHMHRLVTADWSATVPANTATNPRVDRIVLRLDSTANTVALARLQGTAAASPVAPALTQVNDGIWEIPLWRFTVPANSSAPLTGLTDDRAWIGPEAAGGGGGGRIVAYGSSTSSQQTPTGSNEARLLGGLNLQPTLSPGRIYEVAWTGFKNVPSAASLYLSVRAIAGTTPPVAGAGGTFSGAIGTFVAEETTFAPTVTSYVFQSGFSVAGTFTVSTAGVYSISPFLYGGGTSTAGPMSTAQGGSIPMTLIVRDAGPASGVVGTTPIAVP
jgi:hypothetical protein